MRALLVVNPTATTTSVRVRSVLTHALASDFKLDVAETTHRGHAGELATQARQDGLDAVVVLGGDGTVNEVVNGLLTGTHSALDAPALAVVPGGCANVFARALGLPSDPVEATAVVLDAFAAERIRTIGLGRADERYFTFCAGLGLDASAVRRVESHREEGALTPWQYVRAATREFFTRSAMDHRHPELRLRLAEEPELAVHLALVCNTRPWTYLGDRPVVPCPEACFDTGLDVFALRKVRLSTTLLALGRMLSSGRPRGRYVVGRHDLAGFEIRATRSLPFQVDGDYLGEREQVRFMSVPGALRVVA